MIPELKLNDGNLIPQLGFGVFKVDPEEAESAVSAALNAGYRHIDTAAIYANEEGVGRAIAKSGIPREELFITTKLWNHAHERDQALVAIDESLGRLGLDYVDLYLIHWPTPWKDDYVEAWQALIEIRDAGKTRSIGVSNFNPDHLERIIRETGVVPAVNQVELHPAFSQPEIRRIDEELGIKTESWGPLGQGKYDLLERQDIEDIAQKHSVTPAQVVIRWHLQLGLILFPKTTSPARMRENLEVFDFELDDADMAVINAMHIGMRIGVDPEEVKP